MLKVHLVKNLRKSILRGHPWLYQNAIELSSSSSRVSFCKVLDVKGKFLAWGYHDPQSPLAVRILSLKDKPPSDIEIYNNRISQCWQQRLSGFNLEETNAFRLINGEGDLLPLSLIHI